MVIMIKINGSKNHIDPQAEPLLGAASGSNSSSLNKYDPTDGENNKRADPPKKQWR
jgi:hypothetical protein